MPQTLLALGAILAFAYFAFSQHQATADVEKSVVSAEYEHAAAEVGQSRLAAVTAYPFDEVDLHREGVRISPSGLSTVGRDDGETAEAHFDDVDDFHAAPARPVDVLWVGQPLAFRDSVSVRYVDPATLAPVAGPSLAKEVTVFVRAVPVGWIGTPPIVAELRQIVTPTR